MTAAKRKRHSRERADGQALASDEQVDRALLCASRTICTAACDDVWAPSPTVLDVARASSDRFHRRCTPDLNLLWHARRMTWSR